MKKFDLIDISGDAGVRAYGRDLPELFSNAAAGLYSLITDPGDVRPQETHAFAAAADSREGLLVAWLNELIFQFDTYGFVGKIATVTGLACQETAQPGTPGCTVSADVAGETFDPERHARKLLPKAATYHKLSIEQRDDRWEADVIIDI